MNRKEMIYFVEEKVKNGIDKKEAIRKLAIVLNSEDPEDFAEIWFQQKISGE